MAVFGAEQVHASNKSSHFFDKYIVAINIGGMFATLAVPYIQVALADHKRYFYGYVSAVISLTLAFLLFIFGHKYYIHIEPHDTIITKCIPVIINAFQTRRKYKVNRAQSANIRQNSSSSNLLVESSENKEIQAPMTNGHSLSFLDFARASNNGNYIDRVVDDVKSLRLVIIVFLLLIPYWLVYYQVEMTWFSIHKITSSY